MFVKMCWSEFKRALLKKLKLSLNWEGMGAQVGKITNKRKWTGIEKVKSMTWLKVWIWVNRSSRKEGRRMNEWLYDGKTRCKKMSWPWGERAIATGRFLVNIEIRGRLRTSRNIGIRKRMLLASIVSKCNGDMCYVMVRRLVYKHSWDIAWKTSSSWLLKVV